MKKLSETDQPALLRTDFAHGRAWKSIKQTIMGGEDDDEIDAYVPLDVVDEIDFDGVTTEQIVAAAKRGYAHTYITIVDAFAMTERDHPILIQDLRKPERYFRAIASEVVSIAENFEIANLGFDDFLFSVGVGGIYRPKGSR